MVDSQTNEARIYSRQQLKEMAASKPIAYLQERYDKAMHVYISPTDDDMSLFIYDMETEEYFRQTYAKYSVSAQYEEHFEDVSDFEIRDMEHLQQLKEQGLVRYTQRGPAIISKIPKRISGCCDRADQY